MAPTNNATGNRLPRDEPTVHLTVSQAVVRFLANQYTERDGERTKLFAGCFGIFGHGNVAGLGQALLQAEIQDLDAGRKPTLPYVLGRNEQAMVHSAVAHARMKDRLQTWAVSSSVGPGATNMITAEGLEVLEAELAALEGDGRREIAERIKTAREWGDLKENSEYHDAKNEQAPLES